MTPTARPELPDFPSFQVLLGCLERNEWPRQTLIKCFGDHLPLADRAAVHGSTDAAISLVEAILPGFRIRLDIGRRKRAWLISPTNGKVDVYADTPARALLIAALRALVAQEGA